MYCDNDSSFSEGEEEYCAAKRVCSVSRVMNSFGSHGETELNQSHSPYSCSDSEQRIEHFTTMSDTSSFSTSLTSQALGQALVDVSRLTVSLKVTVKMSLFFRVTKRII